LEQELEERRICELIGLSENEGIARGCNRALDSIMSASKRYPYREPYDLIIKMDNDTEVLTENILACVSAVYAGGQANNWIMAPRDEGIDKQQKRHSYHKVNGWTIGRPTMVGGRFMIVPAWVYDKYRFPDTIALARGADSALSHWHHTHGGQLGYIEDLAVNHYETTAGQIKRYPEYFKRKKIEEEM
jgi:hypothetical protein